MFLPADCWLPSCRLHFAGTGWGCTRLRLRLLCCCTEQCRAQALAGSGGVREQQIGNVLEPACTSWR